MIHAAIQSAEKSKTVPAHVHQGHNHSEVTQEERVTSGGLASSLDGYTLWLDQHILPTGTLHPLTFRILGPNGVPVTRFTPQHEHDLHAVIIRSDLQHFQHLHPVHDANGQWTLPLALPEGGSYRLLADFLTEGEDFVLGTNLFAPGHFSPQPLPSPSLSVDINGYRVTLDPPGKLLAGQGVELRFSITRPDGRYVSLKPVMGVLGHLVALREGDLAYLHAHPVAKAETTAGLAASVAFHLAVPSVGRYRLFLQFSEAGRISTAAFTLEVPPVPVRESQTPIPVPPPAIAHSHAGHAHH